MINKLKILLTKLKNKFNLFTSLNINNENRLLLQDIEKILSQTKTITKSSDTLIRDLYYHKRLINTYCLTISNNEIKEFFDSKLSNIEKHIAYINTIFLFIEKLKTKLYEKSKIAKNNQNFENISALRIELYSDLILIQKLYSNIMHEHIYNDLKDTLNLLNIPYKG